MLFQTEKTKQSESLQNTDFLNIYKRERAFFSPHQFSTLLLINLIHYGHMTEANNTMQYFKACFIFHIQKQYILQVTTAKLKVDG